jgi:leucyl/phenylalanyl-tRNA--protein transferase
MGWRPTIIRAVIERRVVFPPPEHASPDGIVAMGGRPDPDVLLAAYSQGIFPWPHEGWPMFWFSPDPRFVLIPGEAHLSHSLARLMRKGDLEIRIDTAFGDVIRRCAQKPRPGQDGTWITRGMIRGFCALAQQGFAHSVEAWRDGRLVAGLYGVSLGSVFFGESMFTDEPNASKVCLATLLGNLVHWGFSLLDCQAETPTLAAFGARDWPRRRFLATLARALQAPTRQGPWTFDLGPAEAAARLRGALRGQLC